MDSSRFIELVLDLHNKYGIALGISDVYAYSALGRVIKAVGTVIVSPNSPMLLIKTPRTISMYLMSNGTVLGLVDILIGTLGLGDCEGRRIEVTNDLYKPPSVLVAIDVTNCRNDTINFIKGVGRKYGVNLEVWVANELGMENTKVVFRDGIKDLKHLVRIVIMMAALTNIRGNNDINPVLQLINELMRKY